MTAAWHAIQGPFIFVWDGLCEVFIQYPLLAGLVLAVAILAVGFIFLGTQR
jgi:hypothetical protein